MRERTLVFGGVDLVGDLGLVYSSFEEELPQPKLITVEIPGGADKDITEAVGPVAFHNGKHVLRFLLYRDTQADRLEAKRNALTRLHGKRDYYQLSWDAGYTYLGRCVVEVTHFTDNADLVKLTIDRYPWKTKGMESVDIESHPTGSYTLQGSERYADVSIVLAQQASVSVGGGAAETYAAGTHTLASQLYGDTEIAVTVADWLMYVDDGDLVVNSDHWDGVEDGDATISATYTISGTDMQFADEADQHSTLKFTRKDL